MVRLKGIAGKATSTAGKVFQFLMVRLKVLSTPEIAARKVFQFLMVRLKVMKKKRNFGLIDISIPYGSIKRTLSVARLKKFSYFNSLWFD